MLTGKVYCLSVADVTITKIAHSAHVVAGLRTEPRLVDRQVSSVERQDIPASTLLGRSGRPSVGPGGSVRRPATTELFPFAGELEGALADWLGDGLVRCDGGETFDRGLALGSQTVDQTQ